MALSVALPENTSDIMCTAEQFLEASEILVGATQLSEETSKEVQRIIDIAKHFAENHGIILYKSDSTKNLLKAMRSSTTFVQQGIARHVDKIVKSKTTIETSSRSIHQSERPSEALVDSMLSPENPIPAELNKLLKGTKVSLSSFLLIARLMNSDVFCMNDVAKIMGVSTAAATIQIDRLEKLNLTERRVELVADRRKKQTQLSQAGRDFVLNNNRILESLVSGRQDESLLKAFIDLIFLPNSDLLFELNKSLSSENISLSQFFLMTRLTSNITYYMKDIAQFMQVSAPAADGQIHKLETLDYVQRQDSNDDAKRRQVKLTPNGHKLISEMRAFMLSEKSDS